MIHTRTPKNPRVERGRKEVAEKVCGEVGFAEKSEPTAGTEIRE